MLYVYGHIYAASAAWGNQVIYGVCHPDSGQVEKSSPCCMVCSAGFLLGLGEITLPVRAESGQ